MELTKIEILIEIKYPSLNKWYSGFSYKKRHSQAWIIKDKIKELIRGSLDNNQYPRLNTFQLVVFFNNHYDCDNVTPIVKLTVDSLKDLGIIKDDSRKHFLGFCVCFDSSLKKGQTLIVIKEIK